MVNLGPLLSASGLTVEAQYLDVDNPLLPTEEAEAFAEAVGANRVEICGNGGEERCGAFCLAVP